MKKLQNTTLWKLLGQCLHTTMQQLCIRLLGKTN